MWNQFFLENAHFSLNLLAALVLFATMWLYFDAWVSRKTLRDGLKILGLLSLTFSFLIHATFIESTFLTDPILSGDLNMKLVMITKILGYLLLIIGLVLDPLQDHPKLTAALALPAAPLSLLPITIPILAVIVAFLYLRRATLGLENHLKPVSLAFYVMAVYELLCLSDSLKDTTSFSLFQLVTPFGPYWFIQHAFLLIAIVILGRWVFSYLLKRLQTQLFILSSTAVLVIFMLTTITFTGLLLKNLQDETLSRLGTDAKVLQFAIDSKKSSSLSDAQVLAQNPQIVSAIKEKTPGLLPTLSENFLLTKNLSFLTILSDTSQVLARGEDKERIGDSLSEDPLVKRALLGESNSSIGTKDGVLSPEVSVRAFAPIKDEGRIIGAVVTGTNIDNAFVDGVKSATSLEAAIYGDNVLSASTLVAEGGKSRFIGVKEESKTIKTTVLQKGEPYQGDTNILNTPYFGAYLPLKDIDGNPTGMLFVGKPQAGVLQAASRSIELTFLVAVALIVLSTIPAFLISKFMVKQLH